MTTTTRTQDETITLLKTCKAVQSVAKWGQDHDLRFYLNLWDISKTFKGDNTAKWFVDTRGILNFEPGHGTRSPSFRESVAMVEEFIESNGIEVRKVI